MRDFLSINRLSSQEIYKIVQVAINEKYAFSMGRPQYAEALDGKILAMIFQKPSTRTRISFDVGMRQLGGSTIVLNANDMQLGYGETIGDTAQVLSRFVSAIMLRCYKEIDLLELVENATIPVVNALTDEGHPCQILAGMMTFMEHKKDIKNAKIVWVGDFNNMTNSYIELAEIIGFEFVISTPNMNMQQKKKVDKALVNNNKITYKKNPTDAVHSADIVITDTWKSMGDGDKDIAIYTPYQVNEVLVSGAKKDFIFSHCLPAHRGAEVTKEIIDGKHSIVFDEAENRLHVQKAILLYMFGII
jgi:ornithine carbamoyltransferase